MSAALLAQSVFLRGDSCLLLTTRASPLPPPTHASPLLPPPPPNSCSSSSYSCFSSSSSSSQLVLFLLLLQLVLLLFLLLLVLLLCLLLLMLLLFLLTTRASPLPPHNSCFSSCSSQLVLLLFPVLLPTRASPLPPPTRASPLAPCNSFFSSHSCSCFSSSSSQLVLLSSSSQLVSSPPPNPGTLISRLILPTLSHCCRGGVRRQLKAFTRAVHYYESTFHKLPLMIWRETSAQHFMGGEAGNYPLDETLKVSLRHVNEATFECSSYPLEEMEGANFRNTMLENPGFKDENIRLVMPILRIWNLTAMASDLHPRTLARKNEEDSDDATADCTHFCPTFGGMYEIWSTLLQNFLGAARPLQDTLRPKLFRDNPPEQHSSRSTSGKVLIS